MESVTRLLAEKGSTANVQFDKNNNGLIVSGTDQDHKRVLSIVRMIDQEPDAEK